MSDILTDTDPMPFGKYKGVPMSDVDAKYLLWLWDEGVWQERERAIHHYIKVAMNALLKDCPDYILEHKP